jgi:enoyl-CoA hydratase/carnithine racemase
VEVKSHHTSLLNFVASSFLILLYQACHARISTPTAQLRLPELQLGVIPGFGGKDTLSRFLISATYGITMLFMSDSVFFHE